MSIIKYNISIYYEDDGSVTAASNDMDLAENADNEDKAIYALAESILEYAHEFRDNHYDNAPNRKTHIPFVEKALLLGDARKIRDEIVVVTRKQISDKRRSLAEIIGDWKAPDDYELCDFGDTKKITHKITIYLQKTCVRFWFLAIPHFSHMPFI